MSDFSEAPHSSAIEGAGRPPERPSNVPTLAELLRAFAYLTPMPLPRRAASASLGRASLFFPFAGVVIGLLLVAVDRLCAPLPRLPRDAVVVAAWIVLTRGLQVRGFAAGARALLAGRDRSRVLAVLEDPRLGPVGFAAVTVAVVLELLAVSALGPARVWALLFAPMIGRWAMVVCGFSSRSPYKQGPERDYIRGIQFRDFAWTSVYTCALLFGFTEAFGIVVVAVVALLTVGLRVLAHRRFGGVTSDIVAATGEIVEIAVVLLFGALRS